MQCPKCGSTEIEQARKIIVVMQLPGAAVDCAMFYCVMCGIRWFMGKEEK